MKADFNNPKFDIGTIFEVTKDISGFHKKDLIKAGQLFIIIELCPKPNQSPTGPHDYGLIHCSNKGHHYNKVIYRDQETFEKDLFGGSFEIFVKDKNKIFA